MRTNSRENPSRLTRSLSSKLDEPPHSYTQNLTADPRIVDINSSSDSSDLESAFQTAHIPWIEHGYKTRFNLEYQALGREHRYITRTRRKSALICKLSDLLKLLYLLRTRKISAVRSRLALLEISHRRRCAGRVGTFSIARVSRACWHHPYHRRGGESAPPEPQDQRHRRDARGDGKGGRAGPP
jgi:hypothetical protein